MQIGSEHPKNLFRSKVIKPKLGLSLLVILVVLVTLGGGCVTTKRAVPRRTNAPIVAPTVVPVPMQTNRDWDVIKPSGEGDARARDLMFQAADLIENLEVHFVGIVINASYLDETAGLAPGEPFTRVVRERTRRAVDVEDFLLFLDDVLHHRKTDLKEKKTLFISPSRARKGGILIHPDDVFTETPRRYGVAPLAIHHPIPTANVRDAINGDPLGPGWPARYRNPSDERPMIEAIRKTNPDYAFRVEHLIEQINGKRGASKRARNGQAYLTSTVRNRHRGYLMWGAYALSNAKSEREVEELASKLDARNEEWGLHVDIRWRHPDGWQVTIAAAHAMAEKYNVVHATESGARDSNHYGARAADLSIIGLPRTFTLTSPYDDNISKTFDLSGPEHTRDISLEPEIIEWMEEHFKMKKLLNDYPHWNDVAE